MPSGTALSHKRPGKAPEEREDSAVCSKALERLVSNPSFWSITGGLPKPPRYDYSPRLTSDNGRQMVAAALPTSFSNKAPLFGKNETYRELVSRFSKNGEFRESFGKDLREYFAERRVDWLESVWLEWDTRGSAPVIKISPGQTQMCELGGSYVSQSASTKEQLDVLMACACLFLERLYSALDECKTPARTERLFRPDEGGATGYVASVDLKGAAKGGRRK
jgi:hypothetical protein